MSAVYQGSHQGSLVASAKKPRGFAWCANLPRCHSRAKRRVPCGLGGATPAACREDFFGADDVGWDAIPGRGGLETRTILGSLFAQPTRGRSTLVSSDRSVWMGRERNPTGSCPEKSSLCKTVVCLMCRLNRRRSCRSSFDLTVPREVEKNAKKRRH